MSANPSIATPPVIERLLEIFGAEKLALIIRCYDLIQAEDGYGEIEIKVYNGEIKNIRATISLRILNANP